MNASHTADTADTADSAPSAPGASVRADATSVPPTVPPEAIGLSPVRRGLVGVALGAGVGAIAAVLIPRDPR